MRYILWGAFCFLACWGPQPAGAQQPATLSGQVIGNGGRKVENQEFSISGTFGQAIIGSVSNVMTLEAGFWYARHGGDTTIVTTPTTEGLMLSIGQGTALPGRGVTVAVDLSDAKGMAGGDFTITYNTSILTAESVVATSLLTSNGIIITPNLNISGEIRISLAGTSGISSGRGTLLNLTFTVAADAQEGDVVPLQFQSATLRDQSASVISINTRGGSITVGTSRQKGDVDDDGEITSGDAILALRFAAGLQSPTADQKWAADVDNDGEVTSGDAILILRMASGLITEFPQLAFKPATGLTPIFRTAESHVMLDGTLALSISLENAESVTGGDVVLTFGSEAVQVKNVRLDGLASDAISVVNTVSSGELRLSFAGMSESTGSLVLHAILFGVNDAEEAQFGLTGRFYNSEGLPVGRTRRDFAVAVPPKAFELHPNRPNPFNPATAIEYELAEAGDVVLDVYSATGQRVRRLASGKMEAGRYSVSWDGRDAAGREVSSGIYIYRLVVDGTRLSASRRMLLVK